jgi:hypothetical protein
METQLQPPAINWYPLTPETMFEFNKKFILWNSKRNGIAERIYKCADNVLLKTTFDMQQRFEPSVYVDASDLVKDGFTHFAWANEPAKEPLRLRDLKKGDFFLFKEDYKQKLFCPSLVIRKCSDWIKLVQQTSGELYDSSNSDTLWSSEVVLLSAKFSAGDEVVWETQNT